MPVSREDGTRHIGFMTETKYGAAGDTWEFDGSYEEVGLASWFLVWTIHKGDKQVIGEGAIEIHDEDQNYGYVTLKFDLDTTLLKPPFAVAPIEILPNMRRRGWDARRVRDIDAWAFSREGVPPFDVGGPHLARARNDHDALERYLWDRVFAGYIPNGVERVTRAEWPFTLTQVSDFVADAEFAKAWPGCVIYVANREEAIPGMLEVANILGLAGDDTWTVGPFSVLNARWVPPRTALLCHADPMKSRYAAVLYAPEERR